MKWTSCVHNEHSLSLFRRTFRKWINIACGSWFEELTSILRILTWSFVHVFFCEIQIALLSSKVRTFGLRWLWDLVWMTPNASPKILSLQNILVRENRWGFFFFSFISRFRCVFEYTCVSEIASTWRFEYCTSKNMPMITWTSSIETSLLEDCTKVVCSLFLTGVVQ